MKHKTAAQIRVNLEIEFNDGVAEDEIMDLIEDIATATDTVINQSRYGIAGSIHAKSTGSEVRR